MEGVSSLVHVSSMACKAFPQSDRYFIVPLLLKSFYVKQFRVLLPGDSYRV